MTTATYATLAGERALAGLDPDLQTVAQRLYVKIW